MREASKFWQLRRSQVVEANISAAEQRELLRQANTRERRWMVGLVPGLELDIVKILVEEDPDIVQNTKLSTKSYEYLVGLERDEILERLAANSGVPKDLHLKVYNLAMEKGHLLLTRVVSRLAQYSASEEIHERIAGVSLPASLEDPYEYDHAWDIRSQLVGNQYLTSRGAAALSRLDAELETLTLTKLQERLTDPDGPEITLAFNLPFLRKNADKRGRASFVAGRTFLQGVRSTLSADHQEIWDTLMPNWTGSVQDLYDAVQYTSR